MNSRMISELSLGLKNWARQSAISDGALTRLFEMMNSFVSGRTKYDLPDQRPSFYVPGLKAKAWHDLADFKWIPSLVESAEIILAEHRQISETAKLRRHPESDGLVNGSWKILSLFAYGVKNAENCNLLPATTEIVAKIPTAAQASLVYLSSLAPNSKILPHYGPTNCRLRCHFGLNVPKGCWIRVGAESRTWENGNCIIFDDSFIHEVANESELRRDVLIIDFWHPELSAQEQLALQFLTKHLTSAGLLDAR